MRYELADYEWIAIKPMLSNKPRGVPRSATMAAEHLNGGNWAMVKEFVEIESGKNTDRPKLAEAIKACRWRQARHCKAGPGLVAVAPP